MTGSKDCLNQLMFTTCWVNFWCSASATTTLKVTPSRTFNCKFVSIHISVKISINISTQSCYLLESSCIRKQKLRFWHILYSRNSCVFRVCQYIQSFYRFRPDINILNHAFIESRSTWFNGIYYLLPTSLVM